MNTEDTIKKEIIRNDTLLCVKCGKLIDITEVAEIYREEGAKIWRKKYLNFVKKSRK